MLHVIWRWYRLVAFRIRTGTFQALSQCASTNIKALQRVSALTGETSGSQPRLYKGMLYVVLGRRWSCSLNIHAIWFHCVVSKEVSRISAWAFAQHWPKTTRAFWLLFGELCMWSLCVPGPEKWMFLAPGTLLHVTGSLYPSAVADLPSSLTTIVVSRRKVYY